MNSLHMTMTIVGKHLWMNASLPLLQVEFTRDVRSGEQKNPAGIN